MNLAIHRFRLPVRAEQKRRVVHPQSRDSPRSDRCRTESGRPLRAPSSRSAASPSGVVAEREWRGRLWPDDVLGPPTDRIAGHRQIGREDLAAPSPGSAPTCLACATFPCISPTRMGVPSRVNDPSATRHEPQAASPTRSMAVDTPAISRDRPELSSANAIEALTNATSADSPYTPNTLANCATASTVTWLLPRGTQGNPPKSTPRKYSVATHAAGAKNNADRPARVNQPREHHRRDCRKDGQVGGEQQHRQDSEYHRHPAEDRQHAARPVHGAREVHQPGHHAEPEGSPCGLPRQRPWLSAPPAQRKQQRNKGDPGKCRMTVTGKTEREQRS